tara:strand:- start:6167 stop:6451 length:285 start_codon:yes stop_codon:yes gene_type:complete
MFNRELKDRIDLIEEKIAKLDQKLDEVFKILNEQVVPECNKMSNHINFIETVYNTVKRPLGFICNKIRTIMSVGDNFSLTNEVSSPKIENSNCE